MKERIEKILKYLEESGETQSSLARSAGLSVTVVNQILKDKYKGDMEVNLSKIESVIDNRKERALVTFKAPEFIETTIVSKTYGALGEAQNTAIPRMLVLYGNSGIGKTRGLEEYVEDNPTATLIEVSPDFTFGSMLQEIAQEIGVHSTGKHYEIRKRIVSKLKNSNRMLIIDEAEYLTPKSLDILRRIHDKAKIPIVLVGMPALFHNIKSLRKGFEQIANRMVSYNLGVPDDRDMLQIIEACIPRCEDSVAKALIKCSKSTIRTLILLMQDLVNWSASSGQKITASQVEAFVNSMH
ncbi:MAG: AAA family ATPase [Brevinema sp.]